LAWYLQAWASGILVGSNILHENAKQIADEMQIDDFAASDGWIYRFKDHHGLKHRNLAAESTAINTDMRDLWLGKVPTLPEGYEL
jgi:hypothetical protein